MIEQFNQWAKENIGADDHSLVTIGRNNAGGMRFKLPKIQKEYEEWKKRNAQSANKPNL